jgi:hypothetical protein
VDTTGNAAQIKLSSADDAADICIGLKGDDLATVPCTGAPTWKYNSKTHRITNDSSGKCMDITFCGQVPCAGDLVEVYGCNGAHQNQEFSYANGNIVATGVGGKCLGVCAI